MIFEFQVFILICSQYTVLCTEGHVAKRWTAGPNKGSIFIQTFCKVIEEEAKSPHGADISEILNSVCHFVECFLRHHLKQ
jgi:hypothetical protein